MANQSIYSEKWIDLVFENRNKEYGAYQLRHENPKTTLKALGIGFLLITTIVSIPMFMNIFGNKPVITTDNGIIITPLELKHVVFPPEKKPETETAAPLTQKKTEQSKPDVEKSNLIDPTVTDAQNVTTEIAPNNEPQNTFVESIEGAISGNKNSGVKGGTGTSTENTSGTDGTDNGKYVSAVLDKQPTFPGGMNKFYTYVARNFKTPDAEMANTVKVYVSFVIEKDGSMTEIKVLGNPEFGLDKEAIRVLKSLKTKWTPGILNGEPVRTSYNLPIVVQQN